HTYGSALQHNQWRALPHGPEKHNGSLLGPPEAVGRVGVASPSGADIAAGADPEDLLSPWLPQQRQQWRARPHGTGKRNGSLLDRSEDSRVGRVAWPGGGDIAECADPEYILGRCGTRKLKHHAV